MKINTIAHHRSPEETMFLRLSDGWRADGHEGEWAAIAGYSLLGFFPDAQTGYDSATRLLGHTMFLLAKIGPHTEQTNGRRRQRKAPAIRRQRANS